MKKLLLSGLICASLFVFGCSRANTPIKSERVAVRDAKINSEIYVRFETVKNYEFYADVRNVKVEIETGLNGTYVLITDDASEYSYFKSVIVYVRTKEQKNQWDMKLKEIVERNFNPKDISLSN